jgi:hypothetical protein
MSSASYFITPQQPWSRIGTADAPMILGLSAPAADDDHGLLQRGFVVYDALFGLGAAQLARQDGRKGSMR